MGSLKIEKFGLCTITLFLLGSLPPIDCLKIPVLDSVPASSGTGESEGQQMKQFRIMYIKRIQAKITVKLFYNYSIAECIKMVTFYYQNIVL